MDVATFQSHRSHLFSVAYRMLGSASEAEDVLQDTWLRAAAAPATPDSPRAWLTTVLTRLCLDRLKSARARREEYVGPWLPEPVPTAAVESGEDQAIRRESITMAFLVLLETLTPAERAAFILREVFDDDYDSVARVLEATPAAARQLVHRAKARLAAGKPRFDVTPRRQQEIVSHFLDAVRDGDLPRLQQYLAADVLFTSDGGGKAVSARRPIRGSDGVGRLMHGFWRTAAAGPDAGEWRVQAASVNGEAALLVHHGRHLESVFVFSTDAEQIQAIRVARNPDKLRWIERHTA